MINFIPINKNLALIKVIAILGIVPFALLTVFKPNPSLFVIAGLLVIWLQIISPNFIFSIFVIITLFPPFAVLDIVGVPSGYQGMVSIFLVGIPTLIILIKEHHFGYLVRVPSIAIYFLSIYLFITLSWSINPPYGWLKVQGFIFYGVFSFILGICVGSNVERIRTFAWCIIFSIVIFIVDLLGLFTISGLNIGMIDKLNMNPIWIGRSIGLSLIFIAYLYFNTSVKSRAIKTSYLLAIIIGATILFLTGSRGPVLGLLCVIIFAVIYWKQFSNHYRPALLIFITCALFLSFWIALSTEYETMSRFSQEKINSDIISLDGRFYLWQEAILDFLSHPLFGIGVGSFKALPSFFFYRDYPHNITFEVAAELGLIGLLLFFAISIPVLRRLWYLRDSRSLEVFLSGGIFIFGFVNSQLSGDLTANHMLWFGAGMILAVTDVFKENPI